MLNLFYILMAANGSEFLYNMWNHSFSPWTSLFARFVGNGNIFFLFPLIVLTVGLHFKTRNPPLVSCFMIGSGALLGFGTLSMGIPDLPLLFGIFATIGLIPVFTFIFFGE